MKIALFAAVPEEVGELASIFHFTGIGRENATRAMVRFMEDHKDEDFIIVNAGTVGSPNKPVGTILSIEEVVSAGSPFNSEKMRLDHLNVAAEQSLKRGVLYSSDSFVSPEVYTASYLEKIKTQADCFDMEAAALYSVSSVFGKKYVSYKIVSDNLDVTLEVWQQRVKELSKNLVAHLQIVLQEIKENEGLEILM